MFLNSRKYLPVLLVILLLLPDNARANHGVQALAGLEIIVGIGIAVISLSLVNFILSMFNISRKSAGLRFVNIVLTLPALGVSVWLCYCKLVFGLIPLSCVFLQALIIYASFGKRDETDM